MTTTTEPPNTVPLSVEHTPRSMLDGRHDDSIRRRQRERTCRDRPRHRRRRLGASAIARAAEVDRTFLYRHRDLLEKIHALQADPVPTEHTGPAVTRASLQADLLAAHERAARLDAASANSRSGSPKHSTNKPGASPDSAPPPTSMHSTNGSTISNSRSSTNNNNSTNATKTSPPPAPPTANS